MNHMCRFRTFFVSILFVMLFVSVLGFAEGRPEELITEDDVLEMVRSNQVNVLEVLSDTCGNCHGGDAEYPVLGAALGYENSGHNLGFDKHAQNSYYANGSGCQQCHTNEGFIDYIENGELTSDYVNYPSQIGCFTCHAPHETGDFSLITYDPVTLKDGSVFNKGDGNLCANCHQSRSVAGDVVKPTPANKVSSRFGPHHGPEADAFMGVNAYEFEGKSYSSSMHTYVIEDSCVTCHMALPEGRYSLSPEVGGHSFYTKGEVHESEKLNLAACSQCHDGIKQADEFFDIKTVDYDNDGTLEPVQAEVEGLLHLLINAENTGLLQTTSPPLFKADGSWASTSSEVERSVAEMAGIFNYRFFEEDRSLGIHNTKYAVQVLYDTIGSLDPTFDTANRP